MGNVILLSQNHEKCKVWFYFRVLKKTTVSNRNFVADHLMGFTESLSL